MRAAPQRRLGARWALAAIAIYLTGAVALSWPLAAHLRDATPSTWQDSRHIVWLLTWDAHVLKTDPTDLFQAPNFWPERDVLTYTDHIMGLGIFAAPIIWATGNAYLAHNLLFIAAIGFSGFAAFLLAFDLSRRRAAAFVAGAVFAFAPYWFGPTINLSHLQTLTCGWIPLALLGLSRWVRSGAWRHLALLAGAFVMGTLTSFYESVFLVVALVVAAPFLLWGARPIAWRRLLLQGITGAVIAGAILAPFTLPYRRPQQRFPTYTRKLDEASRYSASASSYLAAPPTNILYGDATERWRKRQISLESDLFPGFAVLILAGVGLSSIRRSGLRPATFAGFAALGAAGVVLAIGGATKGVRRFFPWSFLFDHVVFFRGLRAPARIHVLTLVALSVFAALGARRLIDRLPRRVWPRAAAALILMGVIALEGAAVPIALGPAVRPTPEYASLADRPGAILELPTGFHVPGLRNWSQTRIYDVDYMLLGTAHWRPLVNGLSSFEPPFYRVFMDAMATLPDAQSLAMLRRYQVRTILIHTDRLRRTPWRGIEERMSNVKGVSLLARWGRVLVYDVSPS